MEVNLQPAMDRIRASEGGWRFAVSERGGASFCGITLGSYQDYCKAHSLPAPTLDDWKAISPADPLTAQQIMDFYLWAVFDPVRFIELPPGVDYAVADWCVNTGDAGALGDIRWLFGLDKPEKYWRMDDALLKALSTPPPALVVDAICNLRFARMQVKPDYLTASIKPGRILGDGRAFRMSSVHRGAMEMIGFTAEPDKYISPVLTPPPAVT